MPFRHLALVSAVLLLAPGVSRAQSAPPLLYRVFLADGTGLASFGEWARVDDRLVFSMPVTPGAGPSELHLVSLPIRRVDMHRTERYANSVRAASYAATRGEGDFARLSDAVAQALNQIASEANPVVRLVTAERARRMLTEWPGASYGYRGAEVREIVAVLDEVIAGLRAVSGDTGRFDLSLSATTSEAPTIEPLLPPPDHTQVVQGLMSASMAVESPEEKVSLLQSVIALVDRAVDLLPEAFARAIRSTAALEIAEEQRIDRQYARLQSSTLTAATQHGAQADVRSLERLRRQVQSQDQRLGGRRPDTVAALVATLDAHLDAAHRMRLAQDQWLLRIDRLRAYQQASAAYVDALAGSSPGLDDIRSLAGPTPQRLRIMAERLGRAARQLAILTPPDELAAVHALFRSAFSLATNAVQLRLDAAAAADVELARQAAAAASGAVMLLERARSDLAATLKPPIEPHD
jgi:hypothetical protein